MGDKGEDVKEGDIPDDISAKVEELRSVLVEFVAEASEDLLNAYLKRELLNSNYFWFASENLGRRSYSCILWFSVQK